MFKKHPTPLLIQLVGLTVILFSFCSISVSGTAVIFPSGPGSYDLAQTTCANAGGSLIEVRTTAIYNEYVGLMAQQQTHRRDVTAFLGGSRERCAATWREVRSCEWCWRGDWRTPCSPWDVFYLSALRPWGRGIPGMFVAWAFPYPAGPRTQQYVAHVFSLRGWVDAMYQSRAGMSHVVCQMLGTETTTEPPVTDDVTEGPGSQEGELARGWWDEQIVIPRRNGVKNNWWIIMAVCFIAGGSGLAALYYFVIRAKSEKEPEEFEEYGTNADEELHSESTQMETESYASTY